MSGCRVLQYRAILCCRLSSCQLSSGDSITLLKAQLQKANEEIKRLNLEVAAILKDLMTTNDAWSEAASGRAKLQKKLDNLLAS